MCRVAKHVSMEIREQAQKNKFICDTLFRALDIRKAKVVIESVPTGKRDWRAGCVVAMATPEILLCLDFRDDHFIASLPDVAFLHTLMRWHEETTLIRPQELIAILIQAIAHSLLNLTN